MSLKSEDLIRFDEYVIDRPRRSVEWRNDPVILNRKTFDLLSYLVDNRERVVPKEELLQVLWPDQFVEESNLTQHIFLLRKALSRQQPGRKMIETFPGSGYRFMATLIETSPVEESFVLPVPQPITTATIAAGEDEGQIELQASAAQPAPEPDLPESVSAPAPGAAPMRRYVVPALGLIAGLLLLYFVYVRLTLPPAGLAVVATHRLTNDGMPKDPYFFRTALVSDGRQLYFTEARDNQSVMAHVPIEGGDVQSSAGPYPNAALVDYSPVLHELLIGSARNTTDDRPILAESVPEDSAPASDPRQIGELTGHDATWSPKADRIAYAKGRFLYIANADGSDSRLIASSDGNILQPRWSPDGRTLCFTRAGDSLETQIWEVGADGSNLHQILAERPDRNRMSGGIWSGDGRYFFYSVGDESTKSIWVVPTRHAPWPARSAEPRELVAGGVDMWTDPLPSADGLRVWAIGKTLRGEVNRIDPKTRKVSPFLGGISAEGVSFSPDGAWIAYTAYPEGILWRSRPDGSDKLQLTSSPTIARFPRWSPDGKTIAFVGGIPDLKWRLFLVSPAGGKVEQLLDDDASEGVASWSPDGKQIAFGRLVKYGAISDPNLSIEIVDVARRSRTTLHSSAGLWTPRWSPNGRYFTAVTEDNRTLRLYDTQTREWSDLANVGVNDVIWSPDGQFVYFDTIFGADSRIYRVQIANRKLEQWADLTGFHRGGFFSPWLGMSLDGSPILLRDTSIQEVYQLSLEPTD